MNDMNLSVIIPTHVLNEDFKLCLKSLENAALHHIIELIVVLDGIQNDLSFFNQFNIQFLKVIEQKQNKGPAASRNEGAKEATGDILFFIDSDVMIKPDTFNRVRDYYMGSNAKNALIGSYDNDPKQKSLVSYYRNLLHHYTHQQASENAITFWGGCGAIKKDDFLSIGGFNTSFKQPSVEDIELGYRLVQNGYNIHLDKNLQVKHLKKWTIKGMLETDIFQRAIPWTKLLHQYGRLEVNDLNVNYEERFAIVLLCCAIATLIGALVIHTLLPFSILLFAGLVLVKLRIYLFFANRFATYQLPLVIFLHWVYLLRSAIGFILGSIEYLTSGNNTNHNSTQNEDCH